MFKRMTPNCLLSKSRLLKSFSKQYLEKGYMKLSLLSSGFSNE